MPEVNVTHQMDIGNMRLFLQIYDAQKGYFDMFLSVRRAYPGREITNFQENEVDGKLKLYFELSERRP